MAVTPKSLLEAAAEISVGGREVDWRNSASRGYYAAYHFDQADAETALDASRR